MIDVILKIENNIERRENIKWIKTHAVYIALV